MSHPEKALSIRQPWAWLIVNGHKDIENRCWKTHFRGKIYVHASMGMTADEYAFADVLAEELGIELPAYAELKRGGIVGTVEIVDCVDQDASPWFFGEFGFVLKNAKPLPFHPLKGKLGFFKVSSPFPASSDAAETLPVAKSPAETRNTDQVGCRVEAAGGNLNKSPN